MRLLYCSTLHTTVCIDTQRGQKRHGALVFSSRMQLAFLLDSAILYGESWRRYVVGVGDIVALFFCLDFFPTILGKVQLEGKKSWATTKKRVSAQIENSLYLPTQFANTYKYIQNSLSVTYTPSD